MVRFEASGSIDVAASREKVYGLVSDLTRMGEWSPENTGGRWLHGAGGPTEGARFRGTNVNGSKRWSVTVTVVEASPPSRFTFTHGVGPLVAARWSYRIDPIDGGRRCRVTESWTSAPPPGAQFIGRMLSGIADRESHTRQMIETTLQRLKATAEAADSA